MYLCFYYSQIICMVINLLAFLRLTQIPLHRLKIKSIIWLKKWEKHISKINEDSNIAIDVLIWWPITYKISTQSWIVTQRKAISVTKWNDLTITNLWWYTKIQITSDVISNFLTKYTNYKILRKIWNKEIIISKWQIKNF